MKHLSEVLKQNNSITELNIAGNEIEDEGMKCLIDLLELNNSLATLDISETIVPIESFCIMLEKNKTLESLYLSKNYIEMEPVSDEIKAIAHLVSLNTPLTNLDLSHNKLGNEGIKLLSEAVKNNHTLEKLNLSNIGMESEGMGYLSELKDNKSITDLNISGNKIGIKGIEYLIDYLNGNSSLTALNISKTLVGAAGMIQLYKALYNNKTISSLYLDSNKIGYDIPEQALVEAECITSLLKFSQSLTFLDLSNNNIGKVVEYLKLGLASNTTLTRLYLYNNNIESADHKSLIETPKGNKDLKIYIDSNDHTTLIGVNELTDESTVE